MFRPRSGSDAGACRPLRPVGTPAIIRSLDRASSVETLQRSVSPRRADRWQGFEVDGDRLPVDGAEAGGIGDDLSHLAADKIEVGLLTIGQQRDNVVDAPLPDPGFRVRGDVRGRMTAAARRSAGQSAVEVGRAEPIAWRVTIAAAADRGDEVGAPVPLGVLAQIGVPGSGKSRGEDRDRTAGGGKRSAVPGEVELGYGRQAIEKGLEILKIAHAEAVVIREREGRQIMRSVRSDAPAHCPGEIGGPPSTDPSVRIGGDVWRYQAPKSRLDGPAAGIGSAPVLAVGVTLAAAGGGSKIGASRYRLRLGRERGTRSG